MNLNRWKVAACTLTLGVGGLAVFATDKKEPVKETPPATLPLINVKPATPTIGEDTPAGPVKLPAIDDIPNVIVPATLPKPNETTTTKPATPLIEIPQLPSTKEAKPKTAEPVFEPVPELIPVKAEAEIKLPDALKKDAPKPEVKPEAKPVVEPKISLPTVPPPAPLVPPEPEKLAPKPATTTPKIETDLPEKFDIKLPSTPKATETLPPPANLNPKVPTPHVVPPAIPMPQDKPMAPTPAPAPVPPLTSPMVPTPAPYTPVPTVSSAAKLKMLLRMGDGKPRFEIRNTASEELLLKVYGEKIELSSPQDGRPTTLAGVSAVGQVKFTAPGIEGTCDHLTILSATGEVLLKGNIHLKTKRGKTWSEMTAEKMVYQIGTSGLSTPAATTGNVRPVSHTQE